MSRKERRSLAAVVLAYIYLVWTGSVFAAASGNYTDLLPVGAPGNTTVISNGSGWSLTTTAPSQTFGDAISRAPMTVYQSTAAATISNTAVVSTFTTLMTGVGSPTFPASWVASGRTIRWTASGQYSSAGASTWTWAILFGTNTILTTGALPAVTLQSQQFWKAQGLITISGTGSNGTVNASYDIVVTSAAAVGTANQVAFSTATTSAVSVGLTNNLVVNPTFKWGAASTSSSITANHVLVEFLN